MFCKKIGCENCVCPSSATTCEQEDHREAVGNLTSKHVKGNSTVTLSEPPDKDASGLVKKQYFHKFFNSETLNKNGWRTRNIRLMLMIQILYQFYIKKLNNEKIL